jgi:hypothetical protein
VYNSVDCVDPFNLGNPPGVSAHYDCEVRKHMWEFAKETLPHRGSFKTVFDALQLQRCNNVTAPATEDTHTAPYFATPRTTTVIFVDSNASGGGDGSKVRPFSTLEAGIHAAAKGKAPVTVVLREGAYYTEGIVLSAQHSGITIQNFEGEEAVVTGAVKVPVSKTKWSLHRATTNTWRLDLADWDEQPIGTCTIHLYYILGI